METTTQAEKPGSIKLIALILIIISALVSFGNTMSSMRLP